MSAFNDTFDGDGPLDPAKWTTVTTTAGASLTQVAGQARFRTGVLGGGTDKVTVLNRAPAAADRTVSGVIVPDGKGQANEAYLRVNLRAPLAADPDLGNRYFIIFQSWDGAWAFVKQVDGAFVPLSDGTPWTAVPGWAANVPVSFEVTQEGASIEVHVWTGATRPAAPSWSTANETTFPAAGFTGVALSGGGPQREVTWFLDDWRIDPPTTSTSAYTGALAAGVTTALALSTTPAKRASSGAAQLRLSATAAQRATHKPGLVAGRASLGASAFVSRPARTAGTSPASLVLATTATATRRAVGFAPPAVLRIGANEVAARIGVRVVTGAASLMMTTSAALSARQRTSNPQAAALVVGASAPTARRTSTRTTLASFALTGSTATAPARRSTSNAPLGLTAVGSTNGGVRVRAVSAGLRLTTSSVTTALRLAVGRGQLTLTALSGANKPPAARTSTAAAALSATAVVSRPARPTTITPAALGVSAAGSAAAIKSRAVSARQGLGASAVPAKRSARAANSALVLAAGSSSGGVRQPLARAAVFTLTADAGARKTRTYSAEALLRLSALAITSRTRTAGVQPAELRLGAFAAAPVSARTFTLPAAVLVLGAEARAEQPRALRPEAVLTLGASSTHTTTRTAVNAVGAAALRASAQTGTLRRRTAAAAASRGSMVLRVAAALNAQHIRVVAATFALNVSAGATRTAIVRATAPLYLSDYGQLAEGGRPREVVALLTLGASAQVTRTTITASSTPALVIRASETHRTAHTAMGSTAGVSLTARADLRTTRAAVAVASLLLAAQGTAARSARPLPVVAAFVLAARVLTLSSQRDASAGTATLLLSASDTEEGGGQVRVAGVNNAVLVLTASSAARNPTAPVLPPLRPSVAAPRTGWSTVDAVTRWTISDAYVGRR